MFNDFHLFIIEELLFIYDTLGRERKAFDYIKNTE